ncbi:hypothetical protein EGW08_007704, partial [Elysia chlorotica]
VHPLPAYVLERSLSCSGVEPPHSRTSSARSSAHYSSDTASCSSVEGMILGGLTAHHNLSTNPGGGALTSTSLSPSDSSDKPTASESATTLPPSKDLSQNASTGSTNETETETESKSCSTAVDKLYSSGEPAAAVRPKSLDPRSLCLPLPFRFLSGKTPSSSSPTGKGKNILEPKSPTGNSPSGSRHVTKGRPAPKQSWLLRLFESKMFDMSIAIQYLYNSKEPGVQTYIGNRMFSFEESEVDFYLPQLLNMYIHMHDVAEAIHPYLLHRCRSSVEFSVNSAWLLSAFSADTFKPNWKNSQGIKLRDMILNEELR